MKKDYNTPYKESSFYFPPSNTKDTTNVSEDWNLSSKIWRSDFLLSHLEITEGVEYGDGTFFFTKDIKEFVIRLKNEFRGRHSVKLIKEIDGAIDKLLGEKLT